MQRQRRRSNDGRSSGDKKENKTKSYTNIK